MPKNALNTMTIAQLKTELARRAKAEKRLLKRRAALVRELAAIDKEIGGSAPAPVARRGRKPGPKAGKAAAKATPKPPKAKKAPRKRAKNTMTLPDAMTAVMSKETAMGVKEIAAAVTAAGYKSKSKTFDTIIYQALKKDKRFAKAERGRYILAP